MSEQALPKRNYQDSVFRMLFSDTESAIELFNALEGTNYGPDTEVRFTTLDDAVYTDLKNDLGFIIGQHFVVLTEHQSSINNNMPLRQLQYIGRTYEKVLDAVALYASLQVKIPTPEFFVIYTGARKWEADTLRLSDSFLGEAPENSVELVVKIIDMGYNGEKDERSQEVLRRSEKLRGYGTLLGYVREYCAQGNDTRAAVDLAIRRCINEGILKDFLEKNSPEVGRMLFKEITTEEFAEIRAKEAAEESYRLGRSEGIEAGREEGIANLIAAYKEFALPREQILARLIEKYPMDEDEALAYLERYL